MTVKELREALAKFPDDMEVIIKCSPVGNYCDFNAYPDADFIEPMTLSINEYEGGTTKFVTKERLAIGCDEV